MALCNGSEVLGLVTQLLRTLREGYRFSVGGRRCGDAKCCHETGPRRTHGTGMDIMPRL